MMTKKTLLLALPTLLFAVSGPAFADETGSATSSANEAVTLNDGKTITWSDFANAINNPSSITADVDSTALHTAREAYQNALNVSKNAPNILNEKNDTLKAVKARYKTANDALTALKDQRDNMTTAEKEETVVVPWLKTILDNAKTYQSAWNPYAEDETAKPSVEPTIYYKITNNRVGSKKILNLAFTSIIPGDDWETASTVEAFWNALYPDNEGIELASAYIYLGEENYPTNSGRLTINSLPTADNDYTIINLAVNELTTLSKETGYTTTQYTEAYTELQQKITAQTAIVNNLATLQATAEDELSDAQTAVTNASANVTSTKAEFDNALSAYNTAVTNAQSNFETNYKNVSLNADVTVDTTISNYNGTINGNNFALNLGSASNMFGTFSGSIANAIINGTFATVQTNATFNDVIYVAGSTYRFYSDDGSRTQYNSLGELGFAARDNFGVNFADNTAARVTAANKVYSVTTYNVTDPSITTDYFVQISGSNLVDSKNVTVNKPNMFIKSATNDLTGVPNVFFSDNTCEEVVITDKTAFYAPANITAAKVSLKRSLNQGYNTVCLPFELSHDQFGADDLLCTYDKETTEKFWFNKVAGTIPANTPALLILQNATELNLSNVTIKQTPADNLVEYEGATDEPSKCYGLFKNATADEIKGASNANKVYGLQSGSSADPKFSPAGNATFPAFRMVIASEIAGTMSAQGAPLKARSIGVIDEKGIEINLGGNLSGVEIVDMEAASLEIAGGAGEIVITTNANYGEQIVYSLDGKAVAVIDVVEGTNTVNVQSGIYIVMGQKVMVK